MVNTDFNGKSLCTLWEWSAFPWDITALCLVFLRGDVQHGRAIKSLIFIIRSITYTPHIPQISHIDNSVMLKMLYVFSWSLCCWVWFFPPSHYTHFSTGFWCCSALSYRCQWRSKVEQRHNGVLYRNLKVEKGATSQSLKCFHAAKLWAANVVCPCLWQDSLEPPPTMDLRRLSSNPIFLRQSRDWPQFLAHLITGLFLFAV